MSDGGVDEKHAFFGLLLFRRRFLVHRSPRAWTLAMILHYLYPAISPEGATTRSNKERWRFLSGERRDCATRTARRNSRSPRTSPAHATPEIILISGLVSCRLRPATRQRPTTYRGARKGREREKGEGEREKDRKRKKERKRGVLPAAENSARF